MLNNKLISLIEKSYEVKVLDYNQIDGSYSKRVWEIKTKNQSYILKFLLDIDPKPDLKHFNLEVEFSKFVNEYKNNHEVRITEFIKDKNGNVLQHIKEDDYFFLTKKENIIRKANLSNYEQIKLGEVMSFLHKITSNFNKDGLFKTNYMRCLTDKEINELPKIFPDNGFKPYLQYMHTLDYNKLGLKRHVVHGDLHQDNISFIDPLLIYDLDTLSYGLAVEEIARTITHWDISTNNIKNFYQNIIEGYKNLTDKELELIPKLAVAQLYRKYFEFRDYGDDFNMDRIKNLIPGFKRVFGLD